MKSAGACKRRHGVGVVMKNSSPEDLHSVALYRWLQTNLLMLLGNCSVLSLEQNSSRLLYMGDCLFLFLPLCFGFLACSETHWYENKVQIDARLPASRPYVPTLHKSWWCTVELNGSKRTEELDCVKFRDKIVWEMHEGVKTLTGIKKSFSVSFWLMLILIFYWCSLACLVSTNGLLLYCGLRIV